MDDKTLAKWLREELLYLQHEIDAYRLEPIGVQKHISIYKEQKLLDAFTALVALLREARQCAEQWPGSRSLTALAARLRTVLGEGR